MKKLIVLFLLFIAITISGQDYYWQKVSDNVFSSTALDDEGSLYGVNPGDTVIFKSEDKGNSWYELPSIFGREIHRIRFHNSKLFAIPYYSNVHQLYYTENNGVTWDSLEIPYYISEFRFNGNDIYMSDYDINIYRIKNYTEPVETIFNESSESMRNYFVVNENEIYIFPIREVVYYTSDGGNLWYDITEQLNVDSYKFNCSAIDSNGNRYIFNTYESDAYKSSDNGNTWMDISAGMSFAARGAKVYGNTLFAWNGYWLYEYNISTNKWSLISRFDSRGELKEFYKYNDAYYAFTDKGVFVADREEPVYPNNYMPLKVGNRWSYRVTDNNGTTIVEREVTGTKTVAGITYYNISNLNYSLGYNRQQNKLFSLKNTFMKLICDFSLPVDAVFENIRTSNTDTTYSIIEKKDTLSNIVVNSRGYKVRYGFEDSFSRYSQYYTSFDYNYFTPGIGLSESIIVDWMGDTTRYELFDALIIDEDGNKSYPLSNSGPVITEVEELQLSSDSNKVKGSFKVRHPFNLLKDDEIILNYTNNVYAEYFYSHDSDTSDVFISEMEYSKIDGLARLLLLINSSYVQSGYKLNCRIVATDNSLQEHRSIYPDEGYLKFDLSSSDVEVIDEDVSSYQLQQNYPNPFNASTLIQFSITQNETVILEVFNSIGEKITTLVNSEFSEGDYRVTFDATYLTSGIYYYRITAGSFTDTKKMILLK